MSEQHYRVIADRDKGDDPKQSDIEESDRVTYGFIGRGFEHGVVRIERPVPTEPCLSTAHHAGHEWGAHDDQPGTGYWCTGFDASEERPSLPTREQIAEAMYRGAHKWEDLAWQHKAAWYERADAVLALLQNGAGRG